MKTAGLLLTLVLTLTFRLAHAAGPYDEARFHGKWDVEKNGVKGIETYDFERFGSGWLVGAHRAQRMGVGTPFKINRRWKQSFRGSVNITGRKLGENGNARHILSEPEITWKDID